jgi:hypothetical protein
MPNRITPTIPNSLTYNRGYSHDVARFRFRKAFPELPRFFGWLIASTSKGLDWHDLLGPYVKKIGQRRSLALVREVHDAQDLGLRSDDTLNNLVCDLLGLDREFLKADGTTSSAFLAELYDRLLALAPPI